MNLRNDQTHNRRDSVPARLMFCLLYAAGTLVYFALPAWGGIFSGIYSFNSSEIGWLLSADMTTNAIANITARWWIHRVNWRWMVAVLVVLNVVSNLLCIGVTDFYALMGLRYVAGFAGGAMVSLAVAGIAMTSKPDSNFGYALSVQVLLGGILLMSVETLVEAYSVASIFITISLPVIATLLLLKNIAPKYQHETSPEYLHGASVHSSIAGFLSGFLPLLIAFAAITLFFTGMNSFWSFADLLGKEVGIDDDFIAVTLSASLLISIAGSLSAAWLGGKVERSKPIVYGTLLTMTSVLIMLILPGNWLFFLCINIFNFGYNFVTPFQSGWVSKLDRTGKNIVLLPAVQGLGISLGPILAGWVVNDQDFIRVVYLSAFSLLLSVIGFIALKRLGSGTERLIVEEVPS